jgi:hypothetical protein
MIVLAAKSRADLALWITRRSFGWTSRTAQALGDRQKQNRWHSWDIKLRELIPDTTVFALVLVYIEMVRGVIGDLMDIPFFGGMDGPRPLMEVKVVPKVGTGYSSDAVVMKTVSASNHDVDALRRGTKNHSHLCLSVLTNRTGRRLAVGMSRGGQPLEEDCHLGITLRKTQVGCSDWIVGRACRSYDKVLADTWAVLRKRSVLRELGFMSGLDFVGNSSLKEDEMVAETMLDFVRELVAGEIESSATYSHRPPFALLACLSSEQATVNKTLAWAKSLWDMLNRFETLEVPNAEVTTKLRETLWPDSVESREWLVGLFENEFKSVPKHIVDRMRDVSRVCWTSVPVEQLNSVLVDEMRQSKGALLGRASKLHRILNSHVWPDSDRKLPTPTMDDRRVAKTVAVKNDMFESRANIFSLGEAALVNAVKGPDRFKTVGNGVYFQSPVATELLVHSGNVEDANLSWLALLAQPGSFIFNVEGGVGQGGYVLASSPNAITTWNVVPSACEGQRYMNFDAVAGKEAWKFTHLKDLKGWYAQAVKAVPPSQVKAKQADGLPLGIVATITGTKVTPILAFAARSGFRGMTIPYLKKLANFIEVDCDRLPTLEIDIVTLLVQTVLPDLDPLELAAILERRCMKFKPKFETCLTAETVEAHADLMDDSMTTDCLKAVKVYAEAVAAMKASSLAAKAKAGIGVGLAGAAGKKKKVIGAKDHMGLAAAKKFLPDGATLSMETEWHTRWKISFPKGLNPPFAKSASFADNPEAKRKSLLHVLTWAWTRAAEVDGTPCPWDLTK